MQRFDAGVLRGLAERVRAAEGPDREIDVLLAIHLADQFTDETVVPFLIKPARREVAGLSKEWEEDPERDNADEFGVLRYTDSHDAGLTLAMQVLPRWSLQLGLNEGYLYPVVTMGRSYPTNLRVAVEHRTAPLTIVLAILSALLAQEADARGAQP